MGAMVLSKEVNKTRIDRAVSSDNIKSGVVFSSLSKKAWHVTVLITDFIITSLRNEII